MIPQVTSSLLGVIDNVKKSAQTHGVGTTAHNFLLQGKALNSGISLVDIVEPARVEPICIVSKDCLDLEYTPAVMQTVLNVFAGYWLQAANLVGNVETAKVSRILEKLNPSRSFNSSFILQSVAQESFTKACPPTVNVYDYALPSISLEASKDPYVFGGGSKKSLNTDKDGYGLRKSETEKSSRFSDTVYKDYETSAAASFSKDANAGLNEASNLAVGKLITVEIKVDTASRIRTIETNDVTKQKADIGDTKYQNGEIGVSSKTQTTYDTEKNSMVIRVPVMVRIAPVIMSTKAVASLATIGTEDRSFSERWHAWRSGRIRFIQDLVFSMDIIKKHKRALMEEEQDVYNNIVNRADMNRVWSLATNNISLATASNLFVIDDGVRDMIERELGGKLTNKRIRDKVFEKNYAMIIVVIDREYERIRMYHRGLDEYTDLTVRDIKVAGKDKGPDVLDILKSYAAGSAPSF